MPVGCATSDLGSAENPVQKSDCRPHSCILASTHLASIEGALRILMPSGQPDQGGVSWQRKGEYTMNLALGLSDSPDLLGIARRNGGIETSVARFEQWMAAPNSPIRAIRHQAAREGEYAEIPASVAPALRDALIARGIPRLY